MSLTLALIANFCLRLGGAAAGLMLTLFLGFINRELYPVSATSLGLLAGAYSLVEMVCAPVLGAQSDRLGRRVFLLGGPAVGLLAVQLTGLTTVFQIIFCARLIEGVAGAATTPALLSLLSAHTDHDAALRGRIMSYFEAGTALGLTLGSVLGSLLWDGLGRWGFAAAGGLYLASIALFMRATANRPLVAEATLPVEHRPRSLAASLQTVLTYRPLLGFVPAWLAINAVVGLWLTHAIFQMTGGRELAGQFLVGAFSSRTIAAVLFGYALAFGCGLAVWSYLFKFFGPIAVMRVASLGMLGATSALVAVNHSGGAGVLLWGSLALFVLCVMVESGFAPAAVTYLADLSASLRADRGLFMGLYSVALGLGQLLGGWLGGPVADAWGLDGILALTLLLVVASVALAFRLKYLNTET
ncbi:MAG: MFS transporter [Chloroflexota bacterium]